MHKRVFIAAGGVLVASIAIGSAAQVASADGSGRSKASDIKNIVVIDLENSLFTTSFGPGSAATYLNGTLLPQGELIENYFSTSHVSQGNYVSQVSGQASTLSQNNDCINIPTIFAPPTTGYYTDITPGTPAPMGQVVGDGCIFPASVKTIGDQLDRKYRREREVRYPWRAYMEDMGNDPARDKGTPDPLGGTTCAHPATGGAGVDLTNSAAVGDQYATRHNGFMYFHSIIDDQARCDQRVVPLGKLTVGTGGAPDTFTGHLAEDFSRRSTTPKFSIISPNLCNDAHDATCKDIDVEGGSAGGLAAGDLWLKHWIPMMMNTPSYRAGEMLIVITFDEAGFSDARACCGAAFGPNNDNPGFSPLLALFHVQTTPTTPGVYPGGGQVGAANESERAMR